MILSIEMARALLLSSATRPVAVAIPIHARFELAVYSRIGSVCLQGVFREPFPPAAVVVSVPCLAACTARATRVVSGLLHCTPTNNRQLGWNMYRAVCAR